MQILVRLVIHLGQGYVTIDNDEQNRDGDRNEASVGSGLARDAAAGRFVEQPRSDRARQGPVQRSQALGQRTGLLRHLPSHERPHRQQDLCRARHRGRRRSQGPQHADPVGLGHPPGRVVVGRQHPVDRDQHQGHHRQPHEGRGACQGNAGCAGGLCEVAAKRAGAVPQPGWHAARQRPGRRHAASRCFRARRAA